MKERKKNLFRKKWFIIILAILVSIIIFVSIIKMINIGKKNCENDSNCVIFRESCCGGCVATNAVNEKYLNTLKIEKVFDCLGGLTIFFCPLSDCLMIPKEPYCNSEKLCDVRLNCDLICEFSETRNYLGIENCNCSETW